MTSAQAQTAWISEENRVLARRPRPSFSLSTASTPYEMPDIAGGMLSGDYSNVHARTDPSELYWMSVTLPKDAPPYSPTLSPSFSVEDAVREKTADLVRVVVHAVRPLTSETLLPERVVVKSGFKSLRYPVETETFATVSSITFASMSLIAADRIDELAVRWRNERLSRLTAELAVRRSEVALWTIDDGDTPNDDAFFDAEAFLSFIPLSAPEPSIYVSGDAEVGYSWTLAAGFLEVAFRGDGHIRYAFQFDSNLNGAVIPFRTADSPQISPELARALRRL
jgi:hypothetical protein